MSGNFEHMKQKLYIVQFEDGYKKPVMAVTTEEVLKEIEEDNQLKDKHIDKIVLEQNYYPQNEDLFDV